MDDTQRLVIASTWSFSPDAVCALDPADLSPSPTDLNRLPKSGITLGEVAICLVRTDTHKWTRSDEFHDTAALQQQVEDSFNMTELPT